MKIFESEQGEMQDSFHYKPFIMGGLMAAIMAGLFGFLGCSSAPPPAPVPMARQQAQFSAETAQKLSQNRNWAAAEKEWQHAASLWSLLYDSTNQAIALHNLAQTHRALEQPESARALLEKAAALNLECKQTNAWWRNQLAIAQIEREQPWTESYLQRLSTLSKLPKPDAPRVLGLYFNEQALANYQQTNYTASHTFYNQAEALFLKEQYHEGLAAVWANRAQLLHAETNHALAQNAWRQALNISQTMGDASGVSRALVGLAQAYIAGNTHLAESEKLLQVSGQNYGYLRQFRDQIYVLKLLCQLKEIQKQSLSDAQTLLAKAHEAYAASLEKGAKKDLARRQYEAAAQLWSVLNQPQAAQKAQEGIHRCGN